MPVITYDQFLTASTLALQSVEGGPASGVNRDWVKKLLLSVLNGLRLPARRYALQNHQLHASRSRRRVVICNVQELLRHRQATKSHIYDKCRPTTMESVSQYMPV